MFTAEGEARGRNSITAIIGQKKILRQELEGIAAAVRSASTLTEDRFLAIGKRLESAIAMLTRVAGTFERLSAELASEELQATTASLSDAAARVDALAGARRGEREALARLVERAGRIDRHLATIRQAVKTIAVLATNAKIAAAGIDGAGADFINFSAEIGRSLALAQTNLDAFAAELAGVARHLQTSSAGEAEFERRHTEGLRSIPGRLATGVAAIATRRSEAATVAAAVGARSQHVQQRVGDAVMALQIGDITRQRLEHVDEAITLLGAVEHGEGDWHGLSDGQRRRLVREVCALQAAQLSDSGAQFEHELRRILAVLGDLASDARAILGLAAEACGGADSGGGIFLHAIEAEVGGAHALLDGFQAARGEADRVAARVSEAAGKLASHIGTVRSLEADIRIMGLNTSLKCARMGSQGRPLSVIAQELRAYANHTAAEAAAIMAGIEQIVAGAQVLGGGEGTAQRGDIVDLGAMLKRSVGRLGAAGEGLAGALATLEREGGAVAALLDGTAGEMSVVEEIGGALRDAADRLREFVDRGAGETEEAGDAAARLMAMLAARYTMAREREIHEAAGGGALPTTQAAPEPATADDFLF